MRKLNIIQACLILSITNFITASQELTLFNQNFHTLDEAGKALDGFLSSEDVETFIFNENRNLLTIELKDGSILKIVLIKDPLCSGYFFSSKENFEIMKSKASFEDLGSGNF